MIKLEDIIKVDNPKKTKVKFNMYSGIDGSSAYENLMNDEKMWNNINAWRQIKSGNSNLDYAEYLIALAQYKELGKEYYVFGGYYKVDKIYLDVKNGVGYKLTLIDKYNNYRKKLIIKINKSIGQSYNRWYEKVIESLEPEIYMPIEISQQEKQAKMFKKEDLLKVAKMMKKEGEVKEQISKVYVRNPYYKEYALQDANGKCQLCGNDAPFINKDGEPFLEVHHVVPLSQGGEDNELNVIALCPNCHRKMHIIQSVNDIEKLKLILNKREKTYEGK